ncbi:hypothetical protein KQX64_12330 [Rhodopseudomonas palustris]|nr:hypothetical protein KQX64_12330 [Rhodopseudomonas palustris]
MKANPELAGVLLDPLRADPLVYVQDSVGDWLNDAAETRPDWVHHVVDEGLAHCQASATQRIASGRCVRLTSLDVRKEQRHRGSAQCAATLVRRLACA